MKGKTLFQTVIIILLVAVVIVLGSIPEKSAWAGTDFQTVPTDDVPPPPDGDGEGPWWQDNIGLICGIGFLILLGGGVVGALLAWWIARGNKNRFPGPGTPGDDIQPPV